MTADADDDFEQILELFASSNPADHTTALIRLRSAAVDGHAEAQFRLGLMLATGGEGLTRDLDQARTWCQAAAEQGIAVAQYNLGLLHAESGEPAKAARWWRIAAINGISEAAGCIDALYRDESTSNRPRTWDDAETKASVILERSDPDAVKTVRFAEYYVDPCLDLLIRRHRFDRNQAEDIVQQFFLELEEPLERGEHRGRLWKDSLRERYGQTRGSFRPYLRQVLINFSRDLLRRKTRVPKTTPDIIDPLIESLTLSEEWSALLDTFSDAMTECRPEALRAATVVRAVLAEGAAQADLCTRLAVSERTLRNDLRLGAEMLRDWILNRMLSQLGTPLAAPLQAGVDLIPEWLHRPSQEKRGRALLFLVLVQRRFHRHQQA